MSRDGKSSPQRPAAARAGWVSRMLGLLRRRNSPSSAPPVLNQAVGTRKRKAAKSVADARHMLKALKAVLDQHSVSRSVLAHLGVVEQALEHRGLPALEDVPTDVLARALSQLEMLVADWSEPGIAALRSQIKSAMAKPGRFDMPRGDASPAKKKPTDFDNSRLLVNEASVSTFMEVRANWETSLTGGR